MCVNVFLCNQKLNFSWIRQEMRNYHRHDVTKVSDFYNGGLWGNNLSFVGWNWNFVSCYIKNVDRHHEIFSSKKEVIKKLSPKSLWQTYMKWTVPQLVWPYTALCGCHDFWPWKLIPQLFKLLLLASAPNRPPHNTLLLWK